MDPNEPLFVVEFQLRGLPHAHVNIYLGYILIYIAKEDSANECSEVDEEDISRYKY